MNDFPRGEATPLARLLPEKTVFLRSGDRVHHIRLSPRRQAALLGSVCAAVMWGAAATGLAVLDRVDRADQERAMAELTTIYEARIAALESGSVAHLAGESVAASETGERALAAAVESLRGRLAALTVERDALAEARDASDAERAGLAEALARADADRAELAATLSRVAAALDSAAAERDDAVAQAARIKAALVALEQGQEQARDRQMQLLARIEEAAEVSIGSLGQMLSRVGVDVEGVIRQLRGEAGAAGGPFVPAPEEVRGAPEAERVVAVMSELETVALLREAAGRMPFATPVAKPRFTSGFGRRRDPINGRQALHSGLDMAGPRGTPILAPAEGVVSYAGRMSGYGIVVKLRHDFGFETVYAHLNRARVRVGDRVARGARIGDMGSTGRSTGTHLHYEIRVNDKPVDPMKFIEAARHVL
jgi:murein DD-endopeptidase MepM/ murein hydrolase activator NlpD